MTDIININRIQTNKTFNLTTLHNETKHTKNENVTLSMFCVNCRSLEAHWDTLQELLLTMSSNGLALEFIDLTEVFKIQDVLHYKINGYRNLLFNTRLDTDDGHGEVGLYISETFTYSKREDNIYPSCI